MELVYGIGTLERAAEEVWSFAKQRRVITFTGEMGAGKTTLIKAICYFIGVKDMVSSPTFSIINQYRVDEDTIYHIDLYRCRDEEEAIRAGVEECLYSGSLCLVEWPSRAMGIIPADSLEVIIEAVDEQNRKLVAGFERRDRSIF